MSNTLLLMVFGIAAVSLVFGAPAFAIDQVLFDPSSTNPGCSENHQCITPQVLRIKTGSQVEWINQSSSIVTVTSGTIDRGPSGLFDEMIKSDDSFTKKFNKPGIYKYFSKIQPWIEGKIIVGEGKLTPFKQFKNGIQAGDIKCKDGYDLIFKKSNGKPACVSERAADRLVDIGWATR